MKVILDDLTGYKFTLHTNIDGSPENVWALRYDGTKPFLFAVEIRIMCFNFFGMMHDLSGFNHFESYELDEYRWKNYIKERGDRHIS